MKQNNPLVSIGLPAFKGSFLKQAIHSILNQTYQNFELIIVNDASPENLDDIISEFLHDDRIKYYKNETNLGSLNIVKNWNKCLSFARGDFFILASDDDIYHQDFVLEMLRLTEKFPGVNIFHSRVAQIDKDGIVKKLTSICPEWESCFDFICNRVSGQRQQYASDFMCKTEVLKGIGGFVDFPVAWYSDDATWFYLAKDSGVAYSNKVLFKFRYSGLNITSFGHGEKKLLANFEYSEWFESFLTNLKIRDDEIIHISAQFKKCINKKIQRTLYLFSYTSILRYLLNNRIKNYFLNRAFLLKAIFIKPLLKYWK